MPRTLAGDVRALLHGGARFRALAVTRCATWWRSAGRYSRRWCASAGSFLITRLSNVARAVRDHIPTLARTAIRHRLPITATALTLLSATLAYDSFSAHPATPPTTPTAAIAEPPSVPLTVDLRRGLPYSVPKLLTVPAIRVRAPIAPTGQLADGAPAVPPMDHPEEVGWYTSSVTPGERGAAVLWGHLDTRTGTAVFINLRSLRPGMKAQVVRADGKVATFVVERTEAFRRDAFPGHVVYDDPGYPALRLVTCAGSFDRKRQEYSENFVVFARLESVTVPLESVPHPAPLNRPIPQPSVSPK